MLLSFSEPKMLPMILHGLTQAGVDLLPGVQAWSRDHFADEFKLAGDRAKVQTIRDNAKGHWNKARRGVRLDMWWLSPRTKFKKPGPRTTPRKLATVPVSFAAEVHIATHRTIKIEGTALSGGGYEELAVKDGFANAAEMVAWFEARHKFPFNGKMIVWGS